MWKKILYIVFAFVAIFSCYIFKAPKIQTLQGNQPKLEDLQRAILLTTWQQTLDNLITRFGTEIKESPNIATCMGHTDFTNQIFEKEETVLCACARARSEINEAAKRSSLVEAYSNCSEELSDLEWNFIAIKLKDSLAKQEKDRSRVYSTLPTFQRCREMFRKQVVTEVELNWTCACVTDAAEKGDQKSLDGMKGNLRLGKFWSNCNQKFLEFIYASTSW